MKDLSQTLHESLFNPDMGNTITNIETQAVYEFLSKYTDVPESKHKYVIRPKARKFELKLDGSQIGPRILIQNYPEPDFPSHMVFNKVENISVCIINCPQLKNLGEMFKDVEFKNSSLQVANCPQFNSVENFPTKIDGDLVLMKLPKLADLDGVTDEVGGIVSIRKIGPWVKKSNVATYFKNNPKILAEELDLEDDSDDIFESFSDGRFSMIWKFVKSRLAKEEDDYYKKYHGFRNFKGFVNYLCSGMHGVIAWDAASANIIDIKLDSINKQQIKLLDSLLSTRSNSEMGMIVGLKGNDIKIVMGNNSVRGTGRYKDSGFYYISDKNTRILQSRWRYGVNLESFEDVQKEYLKDCDRVWVCLSRDFKWDDEVYKLQGERKRAQEGVINPGDAEQYKQIALDNMRRYKNMVAKMKFTREFDMTKINNDVQNLLTRLVRMTTDIQAGKLNIPSYTFENLMRKIDGKYRSEWKRGKTMVLEQSGVLELWRGCTNAAAEINKTKDNDTSSYGADTYKKTFETRKASLEKKIAEADAVFKKYGY